VSAAVWEDDLPEPVAAETIERAREAFRLASSARQWGLNLPVDVEPDAAALSWSIADGADFSLDARQSLLGMPTARERLATETRWLLSAARP